MVIENSETDLASVRCQPDIQVEVSNKQLYKPKVQIRSSPEIIELSTYIGPLWRSLSSFAHLFFIITL